VRPYSITRRSQPAAVGRRAGATYTRPTVVMIGHSQRLAQPLTRLQKRALMFVLVAVLGVSAWAVARAPSAPVSAHGCVNVVVAGSTGGGLLSKCGAPARRWCDAEFASSGALAARIQAQCRLAGLRPQRS
jgi:hypothetical protein